MSQHQFFRRAAVPAQVATKQETLTFPAPTRGLIQSENESYMQPGAAIICDNWKPTMKGAAIRGGCEEWVDLYAASSETTAFLVRTSGLDATHTNAYIALIDGLVTDGVWAKLDVLHVYATQNTATAQLNLVSSSYPATLNGSPTFTVDRGYTGVAASTTVYINTGFNPIVAPSPKFTLNSGHLACWNLTNAATPQPNMGSQDGSNDNYIYVKYNGDSKTYVRLTSASNQGIQFPRGDPRGLTIGNRSSSVALEMYADTTLLTSFGGAAASTIPNTAITALGVSNLGTVGGNADQISMVSIGSSLNSTNVTNFYNRLRTYMTAVGVP